MWHHNNEQTKKKSGKKWSRNRKRRRRKNKNKNKTKNKERTETTAGSPKIKLNMKRGRNRKSINFKCIVIYALWRAILGCFQSERYFLLE